MFELFKKMQNLTAFELSVIGLFSTWIIGALGLLSTWYVIYLNKRKPKLLFFTDGNGGLYRHYDFKLKGYGIIKTHGMLRVKHKEITVVDSKLSYYIDEADFHSNKYCGKQFPPKIDFCRIKEDGLPALFESDRSECQISLAPNGGGKKFEQCFFMSGNFAEEYGEDFFSGKLCREEKMFFKVYIKFQYQYDGDLYWSEEFPINICPRKDQVLNRDGTSMYVDEEGNEVKVIIRETPGSYIKLVKSES